MKSILNLTILGLITHNNMKKYLAVLAVFIGIISLSGEVVYAQDYNPSVDSSVPSGGGGMTQSAPPNNVQAAAPNKVKAGGGVDCDTDKGKICNPIKAGSVDNLLASLLSIVKFVAGIVLVIYFILAGFKYVTARGDEGKIKDAHNMLTWTAVGGAILLGAEVIQKLISGTINQLGTGL